MLNKTNSKQKHVWVALIFTISSIFITNSIVMAESNEKFKYVVPTPTKMVPPTYPKKALERGIEGWVELQFNVNKEGVPYNVMLIDASPRKLFERDARRVIYDWRFEKNKGENNLKYKMKFKLQASD